MIPIGTVGRIIEGKQSDFTATDLTGWFVRVDDVTGYDASGKGQEMYQIFIAKGFDPLGNTIVPNPCPSRWTADCGFDYLIFERTQLDAWFREAGLTVAWEDK